MTFEDAFALRLRHVNNCYAAMFVFLSDPEFNNALNRRWKDANEEFQRAISDIFALKDVWLAVKELPAK